MVLLRVESMIQDVDHFTDVLVPVWNTGPTPRATDSDHMTVCKILSDTKRYRYLKDTHAYKA